jgi:serine/threonine protein kinase
MAASADPRLGTELLGYRIESLLGRGGTGIVYRAEDLRLKRKVALKLLPADLSQDNGFRERLLRESELAASLDHPNIVPIYEAGEDDGHVYIVMRYVDGTDLSSMPREQVAVEPLKAVALVTQLADALDAAHQRGLVHRDVKPSNVLVDKRGHCYLADFGLTRRTTEQDDPPSGRMVGTVDYVAPEQIRGEAVGPRADVYSLGCLLYECLTGEAPFGRASEFEALFAHLDETPPSASARRPELPEAIDPVLARAMAKDPKHRYETCGAVVEAARLALEPTPRRRRLLRVAVAAVTAALPLALTGATSTTSAKPTTAITRDSIQRIDPRTNKLVATIPLPAPLEGSQSVAVGGGSVWAASPEQNTIFQVDPKRNAVTRTLGGSGEPTALSYGAGSLWVLNARDSIVSEIDPKSAAVTATIVLPAGSAGSSLWELPSGARGGPWLKATRDAVWVSWLTPTTNAVRIDPHSAVARKVQIGPHSAGLLRDLIQAGPNTVWASANDRGPFRTALFRVVLEDGAPVGVDKVPLGEYPCCTIAADDNSVWVADAYNDLVLRLDAASGRPRARIAVPHGPFGLTISPGRLWVATDQGILTRLDTGTGKLVATVRVGGRPQTVPLVGASGIWVAVRPR